MRRAAAVQFAVLVLVALPDSARSDTGQEPSPRTRRRLLLLWASCVRVSHSLQTTKWTKTTSPVEAGWWARREATRSRRSRTTRSRIFRGVLGPDVGLSVDDSFGFNGRVGYRCHRRFSAEVEVEWLDGFNVRSHADQGSTNSPRSKYEPIVVTTNVKGYLPDRALPALSARRRGRHDGGHSRCESPVGLSFTGIDSESKTPRSSCASGEASISTPRRTWS